jgi:hypothetical protein
MAAARSRRPSLARMWPRWAFTVTSLIMHARIDGAELPIRQETWRYGSPYTLVLTKTEELFRHEDAERAQALADLAWLRSLFGVAQG